MSDNHDSHHVNYLAVFGALCFFTFLSVVFDVVHLPTPITIVLVLAVAVAKASCVLMFFMHLKFEGNWKYVLLAPTTILAIGLPLALAPDVATPYYTSIAPQRGEWGEEMEQFRAAHAEAHNSEDEAAPESEEPAAEGEEQ